MNKLREALLLFSSNGSQDQETQHMVYPVVATWVIRSGKRQLEELWLASESRV
jgi:hypothetical protein